MSTTTDFIIDSCVSVWVELSFLAFFLLGFFVLRVDVWGRLLKSKAKKGKVTKSFDAALLRKVEEEAASGHAAAVLRAWRRGQARALTPEDLLKPVVQAFLENEPASLVPEILAHLKLHQDNLNERAVQVSILDAVARSGNIKIMVELWDAFYEELDMQRSLSTYEVILGGFASAGLPAKVKEHMNKMSRDLFTTGSQLSPRGFSLVIKGYLKNGLVDDIFHGIYAMSQAGYVVPPFAVGQFFRVASEKQRLPEMFDLVQASSQIITNQEALCAVFEECAKTINLELAQKAEKSLRTLNTPIDEKTYDALLKVYTLAGDAKALDIFKEMQASEHGVSEGLCVGLLARCAEGKFLTFAEEIVRFCRDRKGMSIAVYSALMKVYAFSGMYDKACDLYDQILSEGLEPDSMMYGCLMKFAVECGRTKLSQTLADKVPHMDIQNYMSLIRAAGRDRDVNRAFGVIKQLRQGGMVADAAAYNCVVDVCIQAGDMARAKELVREMKKLGLLDVITYNTFLKGFCAQGDLKGSKAVLVEMESEGLTPNDVSYNCILNTAVCNGNLYEAWDVIDKMEAANIRPDRYTLSIMMKAMKKVHNAKDLNRCFELLERSKIDPCSDEILMNTVLETCTKHRDYDRMESLLVRFEKSNLRPAVPTYGSIIKAFSSLKRPEKCWQYWEDMQNQRGLVPNDIVFGCMLDALVCNGLVEQAVELFQQTPLTKNAVLYSILIKGFANSQQPGRAMDCFWDMKKQGLKMNTVTYNSIIDSQARPGKMEEVSELLSHMAAEGCRPDAITHSTVVKGYCVRGDMDTALKVIREMQREKLPHDAVIYNTILDGCTRHKRMDIVDEILKSMDEQGVRPTNFTLGIIVKLYSRNKQLDLAFRAMETTPKRGNFVANAQVWTCLMCACLTNHEPDKAVKVFHDMKFAGQAPDSKTCTSLITGLIRARRYQQAVHMVEEIYNFGKGVAKGRNNCVELDCLESLLAVLVQEGYKEELAKPLLDKLLAAKVPVSGTLMACAFEMGPQGKGGPRSKASAPRGGKGNYRRA
eukprot:CAMPEP_0197650912 /NCGR_PEP_ID=MMETSP1338-20131121/31235_1 /TAXON_ID=43686 ORGANISM="Pelagodinium beii, Strain RCC1491" /NCGR_SAMPLE_ID=MMETSP1338 /ASSEMBLY_ACC=CAM_ASM_000754 /LENGTH=1040 /DNA_ID=CAMNT_0043225425 /DNA_START=139 /DNA_END=3261 /DNA_ORIENTATION=+